MKLLINPLIKPLIKVRIKIRSKLLIKLLSFDTSSSKEEITSVICFRLDTFHIKMNVLLHIIVIYHFPSLHIIELLHIMACYRCIQSITPTKRVWCHMNFLSDQWKCLGITRCICTFTIIMSQFNTPIK